MVCMNTARAGNENSLEYTESSYCKLYFVIIYSEL